MTGFSNCFVSGFTKLHENLPYGTDHYIFEKGLRGWPPPPPTPTPLKKLWFILPEIMGIKVLMKFSYITVG